MTYFQKYALVSFVSPVAVGIEFAMADWPLHITLADTLAVNRKDSNIEAKLSELLAKCVPATTHALSNSTLGSVQVVLLEKNQELSRLHEQIVDLLEVNGAVFNNPEFTRGGFLPHSTIQKEGKLSIGEKIRIDSLALVDLFVDGDWRQRKVLWQAKMPTNQPMPAT